MLSVFHKLLFNFDELIQRRVRLIVKVSHERRCLLTATKNWFKDRLLLNAGQKYCRMLSSECSKRAFCNTIDLH